MITLETARDLRVFGRLPTDPEEIFRDLFQPQYTRMTGTLDLGSDFPQTHAMLQIRLAFPAGLNSHCAMKGRCLSGNSKLNGGLWRTILELGGCWVCVYPASMKLGPDGSPWSRNKEIQPRC